MKSLGALLCCSLLLSLFLGTVPARATDINGFLGMRWGCSLSDLQQTRKLVLTKENDGSGGSLYALRDQSLRFGKATLDGIHCSFVKKRLQGVILLFTGKKNFAEIRTEATARYGQPIKIEQSEGTLYSWPGTQTNIVLSLTGTTQSGFLFFSPQKHPGKTPVTAEIKEPPPASPPTQPVQPRQPAADSGDLAFFDQASLPENIQEQPFAIPVISPEIQALIDQDQALTRLCWDTVGPGADQACDQMQENARVLQGQGWCMKPGETGDGLHVIWFPCAHPQAPVAAASLPSDSPSPAPQTPQPEENPRTALCRLVAELFAATAEMQEKGVTPLAAEEALRQRQNGRGEQLGIEHIRETVELVYFDQEYSAIPHDQLPGRVEEQCLANEGPYLQPLPLK